MGRVYTVRNQTAGAAAIKTFISWAAAANAVVKLRGMQIGNTAATAAQGTEWELLRKSVNVTGTAQTPSPVDPDAIASRFTALSTVTAEGTDSTVIAEYGFDIVGTYVLWFPPGTESLAVNSGILAIRKTVGADTTNWAITLWIDE